MISYGELIRQIRQSKKISQKEVYTGLLVNLMQLNLKRGHMQYQAYYSRKLSLS